MTDSHKKNEASEPSHRVPTVRTKPSSKKPGWWQKIFNSRATPVDLPPWERYYTRHWVLLRYDKDEELGKRFDIREVLHGRSGQNYVRRLHHRTQQPLDEWRKGVDHEEEIHDCEAIKHVCTDDCHMCPWFTDKIDLGGSFVDPPDVVEIVISLPSEQEEECAEQTTEPKETGPQTFEEIHASREAERKKAEELGMSKRTSKYEI